MQPMHTLSFVTTSNAAPLKMHQEKNRTTTSSIVSLQSSSWYRRFVKQQQIILFHANKPLVKSASSYID